MKEHTQKLASNGRIERYKYITARINNFSGDQWSDMKEREKACGQWTKEIKVCGRIINWSRVTNVPTLNSRHQSLRPSDEITTMYTARLNNLTWVTKVRTATNRRKILRSIDEDKYKIPDGETTMEVGDQCSYMKEHTIACVQGTK
jgi:hypothetical protein